MSRGPRLNRNRVRRAPRGDSRAAARGKHRSNKSGYAVAIRPTPKSPPLHEILGIKTRTVRMLVVSHTSTAETYVDVTLPSLGIFDSPEMEAR